MLFHNASIALNEEALKHNLRRVRALAPQSKIMAMVKGNGYGHGVVEVARALRDADAFGVACFPEAILLREAGIQNRIVLMRGVFTEEELIVAQQLSIELVVHQEEQLTLLEQSSLHTPIRVWLKINTGMNRLGFPSESVRDIYDRLKRLRQVDLPLHILTHFADSDTLTNAQTKAQLMTFQAVTRGWEGEKSLANSAGILAWPEAHADWVRPGMMLYGVSPFKDKIGADHDLKPVMTWQSTLVAIRQQRRGDLIGYGGLGICEEEMRVGIVGIGYADGYPCQAKNGTPVLINGSLASCIGRISMDMLAVDLRSQPCAKIGDVVTLWGEGLAVETVASHMSMSPYELLCRVRLRGK